MLVRYFAHYGTLSGYGRAARDYLLALHEETDVELEIVDLAELGRSPEPRYAVLDALCVARDQLVGVPDVEIYHVPPRVLAALAETAIATCPRIALTTWETAPFPAEYARALLAFDALIVPSAFCEHIIGCASPDGGARLYSRLPIEVVPHCFDPTFWPALETVRLPDSPHPYRFYSIGAWGERKNMLGIVRAYLHAFTKMDNVQLLLVIDRPDFDEIRSVITRSGLPPALLPELHVPDRTEPLTETELVDLHAGGHCFVSAARGEGFGLGLFEAAVMGREIIATDWGGQREFLDVIWGPTFSTSRVHYVSSSPTPCFGGENRGRVVERDGQQVQISTVTLPPGVDCRQTWAEPNLEMLARWMRSVYSRDSPEARTLEHLRNERAALDARFSYAAVGPKLAGILKGFACRNPPSPTPSTA